PTTTIESSGSTSLVQLGNNYFLDSKTTGTGPELMYGSSPWGAGQAWTPIGVEKTSTGYEVALFNASNHLYTIWNTDNNGSVLWSSLSSVSGTNIALESIETSFQQDLNGDGTIGVPPAHSAAATTAPISVAAGATIELSAPYAGQVTFEAASGTLKLDNSSSFSGTVAGMSAQDTIDFADINFASLQQPSFSGNSVGGMLTLTDGTHSANIALLGNYIASTFVTSSDGHGGTYVVDPSALNQSTTLATPHA